MAQITVSQIHALLNEVGNRYPYPASLILLGGSALCLLGSTRPTLDIDYVGDDLHKDELQHKIDEVAQEMQLDVEAVPIEGFIPLPADAQERTVTVGDFGNLTVSILDPYSIALSKLDRGFDSDIEDIVFLVEQKLVDLEQLKAIVHDALPHAQEFALNPKTMFEHFSEVQRQLVKS